jgi:hypothetical protein
MVALADLEAQIAAYLARAEHGALDAPTEAAAARQMLASLAELRAALFRLPDLRDPNIP